ncbi:hypothetical protein IMZ11_02565 [Microtetraspora sp. AC03309]|uniref:hypothetical protein n=1 Tax=Microtetraspora sp. AC03309 TaxID=2779376 RepID=UPI001E4FD2C2|nr:hypothetical protein [Microtetraspora sp. AC03309]MCC5574522.1 hypothetical protein [Microtetraspora sp. AC03309]
MAKNSTARRQSAVDAWNAHVPVGTPVRYWTGVREGEGKTGVTRSEAYLLGASSGQPGHTPVVFVTGAGSCIALTHVQPTGAPTQEEPTPATEESGR